MRYGGYFAMNVSALRKEATNINNAAKKIAKAAKKAAMAAAKIAGSAPVPEPPTADEETPTPEAKAMKTFLGSSWIIILKTIEEEQVLLEEPLPSGPTAPDPPVTPMIDLVKKLSAMIPGLGYATCINSIRMYAERNDIAHSHVGQLVREGQIVTAAQIIAKDICDLDLETCLSVDQCDEARGCIKSCIKLFFRKIVIREGAISEVEAWPKNASGNGYDRSGGPTKIVIDGEEE